MKTSQRRFSKGALNHVYQRTLNGFLIFYSVSDFLVYFTILCVVASKYHVRILMVSLMPSPLVPIQFIDSGFGVGPLVADAKVAHIEEEVGVHNAAADGDAGGDGLALVLEGDAVR